jgi:hypothetical protein
VRSRRCKYLACVALLSFFPYMHALQARKRVQELASLVPSGRTLTRLPLDWTRQSESRIMTSIIGLEQKQCNDGHDIYCSYDTLRDRGSRKPTRRTTARSGTRCICALSFPSVHGRRHHHRLPFSNIQFCATQVVLSTWWKLLFQRRRLAAAALPY